MLFPTWQNKFASSHQIALQFAKVLGEPVTHTGTLDPMAEGVLVLLTGDDRFGKSSFKDWQKVYQFTILWGVSTDSGDKLGLVTDVSTEKLDASILTDILSRFPKNYHQQIPNFSARRLSGSSAFDLAKLQLEMPVKTRQVCVEQISTLVKESEVISQILTKHKYEVHQVKGDFRQTDILENWQMIKSNLPPQLVLTQHQATVSTGTYIRQLVQDISKQVGLPATTWSITRVKNGPYEQLDCVHIEDVLSLV